MENVLLKLIQERPDQLTNNELAARLHEMGIVPKTDRAGCMDQLRMAAEVRFQQEGLRRELQEMVISTPEEAGCMGQVSENKQLQRESFYVDEPADHDEIFATKWEGEPPSALGIYELSREERNKILEREYEKHRVLYEKFKS